MHFLTFVILLDVVVYIERLRVVTTSLAGNGQDSSCPKCKILVLVGVPLRFDNNVVVGAALVNIGKVSTQGVQQLISEDRMIYAVR